MKTIKFILSTFTLLCFISCKEKALNEIGYGEHINGTYRNEYLGFSIRLPDHWHIQNQEQTKGIVDLGGELIAGDDENLKATFKASELTSVVLFFVSKFEMGSPVEFNPNISAVAENIKNVPGIKSGSDYLYHTRTLMESGQIQFEFPGEIYTATVGGKEFDVMDVRLSMGTKQVLQKYYATIIKDYALFFAATGSSENELDEVEATIMTSNFFEP